MSFRFCCPQGHVLQGEGSQAGLSCQCPYCGSVFIVPPVPSISPGSFQAPLLNAGQTGSPPLDSPTARPLAPPPPLAKQETAAGLPPLPPLPGIQRAEFSLGFDPFAKASLPFDLPGEAAEPTGPPNTTFPAEFSADMPLLAETSPPEALEIPEKQTAVLHILCPSGHPLEVTSDLLGKRALCPLCQKQFELRQENSVEYRQRKAATRQQQDQKTGEIWLAWAIFAAALVVVVVIIFALSVGR